ncbi:MAG: hypothetical protein LBN95_05945 [Prevotellaceae bacterium]|jgi:hypothetical protein|nr:hypothetical protein [Prevotellaceae bacterium]
MKKVFIFAAAVAIGFSACQKTELAVDNNLPVKQKTTANSGYSDYILSEADAVALVEKDLQNAGGEFAKKTVAKIEPILFSDFKKSEKEFLKLQQENIIKLSNPALYIVSLQDGGFALVFPDKDFGVSVIHAQTRGETSKEEVCGVLPNNPNDPEYLNFNYWGDRLEGWVLTLFLNRIVIAIDKDGMRIRRDDTIIPGGVVSLVPGNWHTVENGLHTVVVNNFWGTGAPLNSYAATQNVVLNPIAPTVLEFLAFFENPTSLLGINNINWVNVRAYTASSVAPQLAFNINQYCGNSFSMAANLLKNGCSGYYPNAAVVQYNGYDMYQQPTNIVSANRPVIIYFNNEPALAYQEDVQVRDWHWSGGGVVDFYEYKSVIYYKISTSDDAIPAHTENSLLNGNMSYIAY